MENIYIALEMFFTLSNLLAILAGVALGVIVGAIPGLTGTMAVSLALPFTFSLPTLEAVLLLVGIYKGSIYGGSIPAILFKTPGTPAASCTVLDGYPLMEQGYALKALHISLYASCIADIMGGLALIFFTGYIAKIALQFGPPEFFTLICFALTIITSVSGPSLLKGLISAALGLLLATVGIDAVYGTNRFIFDSTELMAGISFIPVLIGVFSLPEMLMALQSRLKQQARSKQSNATITSKEMTAFLPTIVRGGIIGMILGAIPGIGSAPAAFVSYSEAKRYSKKPELYGTGSLEGVAAAEAGNNGVCSAAMIPLLSLGIPGDVITGIILGAFMIHGIAPGPLLFENNISFIYTLYTGFLFSSVFLLIVGLGAIRLFFMATHIPFKFIYPVILCLCFFGVYAVNNQFFDIIIMLGAGLLGYFMMRFSYPAPPFLIAFILGPLCEDNLRRSLILSNGSPEIFIRSYFCIFFLLLTLLSLFVAVRQNVKKQVKKV